MKKLILLIDDEPMYMRVYREELEDELDSEIFEVVFCRDLDKAYKILKKEKDRIAIIILDIMMPSGEVLSNKVTNQGLDSGTVFFRETIRKELGLANTPVILLTNRQAGVISSTLKGEKIFFVLEKTKTVPLDVCEKVKNILGMGIAD